MKHGAQKKSSHSMHFLVASSPTFNANEWLFEKTVIGCWLNSMRCRTFASGLKMEDVWSRNSGSRWCTRAKQPKQYRTFSTPAPWHSLHTREASDSWQYEHNPSFSSLIAGGGLSRSGHDGIKRPDHLSRTSGRYGTWKHRISIEDTK